MLRPETPSFNLWGESARGLRAELRSGHRIEKVTGLVILLVGLVLAPFAGVGFEQAISGHSSWTVPVVQLAVGLALAVVGNLVWRHGRQRSRRFPGDPDPLAQ